MAKEKYLNKVGLKQVIDTIESQINDISEEIDNLVIGQIECDTEFSADSEMPVANRVIKAEFDDIISGATTVGNAETVNGLTVEAAVPANAKFTDTTYDALTNAEIDAILTQ